MNKADNEAGNAAIDSLLNYETVKVSSNPPANHKPTFTVRKRKYSSFQILGFKYKDIMG